MCMYCLLCLKYKSDQLLSPLMCPACACVLNILMAPDRTDLNDLLPYVDWLVTQRSVHIANHSPVYRTNPNIKHATHKHTHTTQSAHAFKPVPVPPPQLH